MTSPFNEFVTSFALPLLLVLQLFSVCEASSGFARGTANWRETSVHSPEEAHDMGANSEEDTDETDDVDMASLMSSGAELLLGGEKHVVPGSAVGATPASVRQAPPLLSDGELPQQQPLWESNFAQGVFESKKFVDAEDANVGSWAFDSGNSGAAVPAAMLQAEVLLKAAEESPTESWKKTTAERALRIYHHAKWLAERNYARAAEHRYREAARLAQLSRRSVLASHALARLGYFLIHWRRTDEAADALKESMKLNTKSNPLAPYLHGILERKAAAGDVDRLRVAEEAILHSGVQPSDELELERFRLIEEIGYWRNAEGSAKQCLASSDTAYVLICLCGHAVSFLRGSLF